MLKVLASGNSREKRLAQPLQSFNASLKQEDEGEVAMKLQNILWVPAVAIALGMVSLAGPVTARQQAQSTQVSASASQPKAAEAVSTSDIYEGADVATTGESFATVALFTPGATAEADAPRQALIGALMAAILMSRNGDHISSLPGRGVTTTR